LSPRIMEMKTFFGEDRRASVQAANGEYYVWFTQQNLELRGKDYRMEIHQAYGKAVEAAKRFCANSRTNRTCH